MIMRNVVGFALTIAGFLTGTAILFWAGVIGSRHEAASVATMSTIGYVLGLWHGISNR